VVIPLHDNNPTKKPAVVTLVIIAICVVVYFFVQDHGNNEGEFIYKNAAVPCELKQGHPIDDFELRSGECQESEVSTEFFPNKNIWLAVLYSMFLHGSFWHLAGNMWFLWIFGNNVEDYLGKIGFVVFYLVAGAVAMGAHFLSDTGSVTPVIGASGAIAGVMGMYLVLWPRARVVSFVPFFFIFLLPLPAFLVLIGWFFLQFLTGPNTGVAWVAHVGGFLFGAAVGLLLKRVKQPEPTGFLS